MLTQRKLFHDLHKTGKDFDVLNMEQNGSNCTFYMPNITSHITTNILNGKQRKYNGLVVDVPLPVILSYFYFYSELQCWITASLSPRH